MKKDELAVIRGGWTDRIGNTYSEYLDKRNPSAVNIHVTKKTKKINKNMKENLYDITESRKNNLKNTGGDIQGKIFQQSLSPFILQDPKYKNILLKMEDIFIFNI